jgi:spermine/spermidine synthase
MIDDRTNTLERRFYPEIFLISLAMILFEISYTRIFSFKLYYYFTYPIIGIALLGIGSGGVFLAIIPRLRNVSPERSIVICSLIAGITTLVGYFVVAMVQLDMLHLAHLAQVLKLTALCLCLFTPFLMAGIVIATLFAASPGDVNRLYFADLLGAGLGCAACIPLIYLLTPPGCVLASGFVFVVAGMRLAAATSRPLFWFGASIAVALLVATVFSSRLPDPVVDVGKGNWESRDRLFSQWSPIFRVDVIRESKDFDFILHDGLPGSGLYRFDGDAAAQKQFDTDPRSYPFRVLNKAVRVLIIGSAGGHEILASLHFGATHVTGVELNPITVSLLTKHFADYSGHLADNDRVTLVNTDGRSFIKRSGAKYDLIWFVAPDSYSAMNAATSGAFVLSESYLYTTGMIRESLEHLTEDGVICMQFGEADFEGKPNRTARYLGTARTAFQEKGVADFGNHVLLATTPGWPANTLSTILLKGTVFTAEEVKRFVDNALVLPGGAVRYPSGLPLHGVADNVISLPEPDLGRWYDAYPFNVRPITDDSPFFWHFTRFRDAVGGGQSVADVEIGTGERVLLILFAFVTVFASVFLLLPFVMIPDTWARTPYKLPAATFFAAIGMGFMFFEVTLIQRFTLFLGYPTYSLTVTLFALLIFTGLGSLLSAQYHGYRNRAVVLLLGLIVVMTLLYQFALGPVVERCIGFGLPLRIALAVLFMAPLGACLGAFMPLGIGTIAVASGGSKEFIAWGWAVNGFFSVISSVLATLLSMTIGFHQVQLLAVLIYAIGVFALTRIPVYEHARDSTEVQVLSPISNAM